MARTVLPFVFGGPLAPAPLNPFAHLQREVNRILGVGDGGSSGGALLDAAPRVEVRESDRELTIRAELPGVKEEDIEIELVDDVLTIRGEKKMEKEEENENVHIMERAYGSFARSIRLPFEVKPEQVQASFENGVLTIRMPKPAHHQNVHQIRLQHGKSAQGASAGMPDRAAAGDKPGAAAEGGSTQGATQGDASGQRKE
jgi:HSP20 family protein